MSNKYNIKILCLFLMLFGSLRLIAQKQEAGDPVEGELIVRMYKEADLRQLLVDVPTKAKLRIKRQLSKNLEIWLLEFNSYQIEGEYLLKIIQQHPLVWQAQANHYTENRATVPNDPEFSQQWQYLNTAGAGGVLDADIDAELAWDYTTGGTTAMGDSIVICVIDDGIDLSHQDILPNLWQNRDEIPNNNIDDDGNGYVDDVNGWNADAANGNITGGTLGASHGTAVAGIIGAKGNNGIGVTGVNWDTKLMIVVGGGDEASALAAYDYPLTERKLYNQTNGREGAFVVATNASWGIPNRLESSFPILCAFYDSLGAAGVLNVAATANANVNIDVQGDLPTHCSSDYLIGVTNTNRNDVKVSTAGYGVQSIDLGAPGNGIYTVANGNSYGNFGGTSAATPHVAGAIGLLYAANCPQLAMLARTAPERTASFMKNYILQGVDPNQSLDTITSTGGRLNLHNSILQLLQTDCSLTSCYAPVGQQVSNLTSTTAAIAWRAVPTSLSYAVRYRAEGMANWINVTVLDTFIQLSSLTTCTKYEIQIASVCDTTQSNYSRSFTFKTSNCCLPPTILNIDSLGQDAVLLSWQNDPNVETYQIEYQIDSTGIWKTINSPSNSVLVENLAACTHYKLRVLSHCAVNVNNAYSTLLNFRTLGCGLCEDLNYCSINANDVSTEYEWIDQVAIGNLNNNSGNNSGYALFPSLNPVFYPAHKYPLTLSIGFNPAPNPNWHYKIWIDLEQDGRFDDPIDLVCESNQIRSVNNFIIHDSLLIPSTANLGSTRMRVAMKWGTSPFDPCTGVSYGEVEDYCILIKNDPSSVVSMNRINIGFEVYPVPLKEQAKLKIFWPYTNDMADLELIDILGRVLKRRSLYLEEGQQFFTLNTAALEAGVYWVNLRLTNGTILSKKVFKN